MSPIFRSDVIAKAGSSSNVTNRDKQWLSRFLDWKTPELKLPKLPRAVFSKKSKKGKGIEIEIVPKTEPIPGHSSEVNNLPPPAPPDNVTDSESSLAPSAPIFNDSPPVFDFFPLDLKFKPSLPSISERHSSSSSDYGHSYRSRSSSGPSVYRGSDPSFPYPLLYESKKPNDHRSLKRQSSGSPSSISPPIPEANRPPSTERGPSALGVDQVQAQHNTILERFVKLGDWEEGGAQSLSVPDKKDNGSPMVEAKGRSAGSGYVGSPSTPNGSNNANVNVAPGTATSAAVGARAAAQDKQSLLANEKRRRRRKSHNAVERRRRDNINEKTSELAMLIPECMLDATASGTGGSPSATAPSPGLLGEPPLIPLPMQDSQPRKGSSGLAGVVGVNVKEEQGGGDSPGGGTTTTTKGGAGGTEVVYVVKASKGMILRKSVEYIRYLQQLAVAQGARNRELERELLVYRGSCSNPNGGGTTSDSEASDAAHGSPPAPSGLRYDNREVEHPKIETTR